MLKEIDAMFTGILIATNSNSDSYPLPNVCIIKVAEKRPNNIIQSKTRWSPFRVNRVKQSKVNSKVKRLSLFKCLDKTYSTYIFFAQPASAIVWNPFLDILLEFFQCSDVFVKFREHNFPHNWTKPPQR